MWFSKRPPISLRWNTNLPIGNVLKESYLEKRVKTFKMGPQRKLKGTLGMEGAMDIQIKQEGNFNFPLSSEQLFIHRGVFPDVDLATRKLLRCLFINYRGRIGQSIWPSFSLCGSCDGSSSQEMSQAGNCDWGRERCGSVDGKGAPTWGSPSWLVYLKAHSLNIQNSLFCNHYWNGHRW